jgi:hypothetical protein
VDKDAPEGKDGGPQPFEVGSMPETKTAVSSTTVDLANSLRVADHPLERLT